MLLCYTGAYFSYTRQNPCYKICWQYWIFCTYFQSHENARSS